MGVLKGFLFAVSGVFLLGGLVVPYVFGVGLFTLLAFAAGAGLAYATFRAARNFNVAQSENQQVQLADTFKLLAERHGGSVPVEALMRATGDTKAGVQSKMRALMAQGVCELDFGPNGEVLFKATPMDEARASLAAMSTKSPTKIG